MRCYTVNGSTQIRVLDSVLLGLGASRGVVGMQQGLATCKHHTHTMISSFKPKHSLAERIATPSNTAIHVWARASTVGAVSALTPRGSPVRM